MTTEQINLVKNSWRIFRSISPAVVADVFYSKLFFDHPELRRLFPNKMEEQYKKLVDMLSSIVGRLENLEEYQNEISNLAKRHEAYGVQSKHYEMVGTALLWTLERGLGSDWNEETCEAWKACYGIVAEKMLLAAN